MLLQLIFVCLPVYLLNNSFVLIFWQSILVIPLIIIVITWILFELIYGEVLLFKFILKHFFASSIVFYFNGCLVVFWLLNVNWVITMDVLRLVFVIRWIKLLKAYIIINVLLILLLVISFQFCLETSFNFLIFEPGVPPSNSILSKITCLI